MSRRQIKRPTPYQLRLAVSAIALSSLVWLPAILPKVDITIVVSTDAADLLRPAIDAYNNRFLGRVMVHMDVIPSGQAESRIFDGSLDPMPDVWMPASTAWALMLNEEAGSPWAENPEPGPFWSPVGVATWPTRGESMGQVGWKQIFAMSTGKKDPGSLGFTEPFRYGHTKPTVSTSGLFATLEQLRHTKNGDISHIERSVAHYGDVAKDYCGLLRDFGQNFVSAAPMQETVLRKCLADAAAAGLPMTMGMYYPDDEAFVADYPCVVMRGPWATASHVDTAEELCRSLENYFIGNPGAITDAFLRPSPVPATFEPDPSLGSSPVRVLQTPDPSSLVAARTEWEAERKHADVLILADICDTNAQQLGNEDEIVNELLRRLDPGTQAGLTTFPDDPTLGFPLAPVESITADPPVSLRVANATDCPLYDTVEGAINDLRDRKTINVVVVVSAGEDGGSTAMPGSLKNAIDHRVDDKSPLQVITVAMTPDGVTTLGEIAHEARSQAFPTDDVRTNEDIATTIAKAL